MKKIILAMFLTSPNFSNAALNPDIMYNDGPKNPITKNTFTLAEIVKFSQNLTRGIGQFSQTSIGILHNIPHNPEGVMTADNESLYDRYIVRFHLSGLGNILKFYSSGEGNHVDLMSWAKAACEYFDIRMLDELGILTGATETRQQYKIGAMLYGIGCAVEPDGTFLKAFFKTRFKNEAGQADYTNEHSPFLTLCNDILRRDLNEDQILNLNKIYEDVFACDHNGTFLDKFETEGIIARLSAILA